jgi:hypothetical protein
MQSLRPQQPEAKSAIESAADFALRLEREEKEQEEMRKLEQFLTKMMRDRELVAA